MTSTALPITDDLRTRARTALDHIGVAVPEGSDFQARTPITGENLFGLPAATEADTEEAIAATRTAFLTWRTTPAPRRGELVRRLGELLREHRLGPLTP